MRIPPLKNERRREPRHDAILPVYFRDAEEFLSQYTENISRGGLFIHTEDILPKGTEVRLSLELPQSRTAIPCSAKVAYVGRSDVDFRQGMGVRFTRMDPAARRVIDSFVELLELRARGYVLVVDDEPEVVDLVTDLLRRNSFNVLQAISVQEAMSVVDHNRIDVILSDVGMPGDTGLDFRRKLLESEDTATIPFIVLTGWEEDENRRIAKELQVTSFLHKPIETKRLVEVLSQALISLQLQDSEGDPRTRYRRRVARTAREHMERLGLHCQVSDEETVVTAKVQLDRLDIVHPETEQRVMSGVLRNVAGGSVTFVTPAFLACLSPIRIDNCRAITALEDAIEMAYAHRMEWVKLGRDAFQRLRIPHRVYSSGFCVLGDHMVADNHVFLTLRDSATMVVEAVNGRPASPAVSPTESIIDLTFADSREEVDVLLQGFVEKHWPAIEAGPSRKADLRPDPPADPGVDDKFFAELEEALGATPEVDVRGLWVVDPSDSEPTTGPSG